MNWFMRAVTNYAGFSGRARRSEYWYFTLFAVLIYIGLSVIDVLAGLVNPATGVGWLALIATLGLLVPTLAVAVRRLHDTDRSGWWLLISLVPLVGSIVLIVFFAQAGNAGTNRFGTDPKQATR